jgi:hypothetical protein
MKYLKKFQTDADYQAFKGSDDWVTPNVSVIEETSELAYNPYTKKIITFIASNLTLQAEEGMTWIEWVNSKYNTCNAVIGYNNGSGLRIDIGTTSSNGLSTTDVIIDGKNYYFSKV